MNAVQRLGVIALGFFSLPLWAGTVYQIRTFGMNCPFCAYGIQKKIDAVPGVQSTQVDLAKGLVTVRVANGVQLRDGQMRAIVQSAGFTFRSMTRESNPPAKQS